MNALFVDDGIDITEIINLAMKEDFLKLKKGDTFMMHWQREKPSKYQVTHIAKDDDEDIHIIAEEILEED